jgi:hypothetical protein
MTYEELQEPQYWWGWWEWVQFWHAHDTNQFPLKTGLSRYAKGSGQGNAVRAKRSEIKPKRTEKLYAI